MGRSSQSLLAHILFDRIHVRILIVLLSLGASFFGVLNPLFQKEFIEAILGHASQIFPHLPFDANDRRIYFLFAVIAAVLIAQIFIQLMTYVAALESNQLQKSLSDRVYEKTLALRTETLRDRPMGEVVSLYTTDVQGASVLIEQSLPTGASILFPFILVPVALVNIYNVPIGATVFTMGLIFIFNLILSTRQARFFLRFKALAAERTGLVNEWVQNIRYLRILGWITSYEARIFRTRELETVGRVQMVTNGQLMSSVAISVTFVVNVVAIMSLVHAQPHAIRSGELIAIMWLVGVFLSRSFRQLPWFLTFIMDGLTSVQRLDKFLKLENLQGSLRSVTTQAVATDPVHSLNGSPKLESSPQPRAVGLSIVGLNLTIDGRALLKSVNFDVHPGEWIAIVGEVGAGKSLILQSMLGETSATFDKYEIQGESVLKNQVSKIRENFAYVPQEGFVMSASLRENIYFDYDTPTTSDPEIEGALKLAQIHLSFERFMDGLATEIGERGVNLSGGQRQRVGLARAQFGQRPILLLDDCLSAVDVDTERTLVESLFCGVWKDRTRILVTHRLSVLPRCDRVLFMQKGVIVATGTYLTLVQQNSAFRAFVREQAEQDERLKRSEVTT